MTSSSTVRDIVVVGGSIAALTAVDTLRAEGFDGSITMLSEEDRGPYTRVPLSKAVLAGRLDVAEITLAAPDDVDLRLRTPATGLDLTRRQVLTADGPVGYDGLVLATGARARRLPEPGGVVLRTHHDCARLADRLGRAASVLVVGGGFLGMEVASTCRELGKDVTVVDLVPAGERLLGDHVAAHVRSTAIASGVRIIVGRQRPYADLVVHAVGDVPNTEWLAGSSLVLECGGVVVDGRGRAAPGVVAAGDVCVVRTADGYSRMPTWTNAVEQARHSALALLHGDDAPAYQPSGYFWTEQFGLDIKMVGAIGPVGPPDVVEEAGEGRLLTWTSGTVIAVDHPVRAAKLKQMVSRSSPGRAPGP